MNVISLQNIEKSYGTRLLFKDVNITFTTDKRLGLVGINGTGKSTFLKILAAQMEPDKGSIERNGKASIHYLAQTPEFDPESTLLEAVLDETILVCGWCNLLNALVVNIVKCKSLVARIVKYRVTI